MKHRFRKKTAMQYLTIYVMLLFNQSNLYEFGIKKVAYASYTIIALLFLIGIVKYRKHFTATLVFIVAMMAFVAFERFLNGGVGLSFWSEMAVKVLITYIAISIDTVNFPTRFVKTVSFLAAISLFFWLFQLMGINLAKILFPQYTSDFYSTSYDYSGFKTVSNIPVYGRLIYSYAEFYQNRNIGIFTEPGIYQSVLNTAIFCLLYFTEYVFISQRKRKILFVLLSICLLSTQSTSGYIGYAIIIIGVLLKRNVSNSKRVKWKRYVARILIAGLAVIVIDFAVRGSDSLLSASVLSKLFTDSGDFSLEAENSTGQYRVASIMMSLLAMIQHPLGMGYDAWYEFSSANELAGAGGWPLKLGAILGVIPLLYLMYWLFKPMKYLKGRLITIAVFVFLYFNTSLAQTSAVYPVLIMIPMFLSIKHANVKKKLEIAKCQTKKINCGSGCSAN